MSKPNQDSSTSISAQKRRLAGARLRAARLYAGIATLEDCARRLDTPGVTLRGAETGRRGIGKSILEQARGVFEVSADFLLGEKPLTPRESHVDELAELLLRVELQVMTSELKSELSGRLILLRERAGIPNATAAAKKFGWGRASYVNYEGRSSKMSLDRAIVFALAFDADMPEFLLGTRGSSRPGGEHMQDVAAATGVEVRGPAAGQPPRASNNYGGTAGEGSPFLGRPSWLSSQLQHGDMVELVLLTPRSGGLVLSDTPIVLPSGMIGNPGGAWEHVFALPMDATGRWSDVAILRHGQAEEGSFVFDGREVRRLRRSEPVDHQDPLDYRPGAPPVVLGRMLAILHSQRG